MLEDTVVLTAKHNLAGAEKQEPKKRKYYISLRKKKSSTTQTIFIVFSVSKYKS